MTDKRVIKYDVLHEYLGATFILVKRMPNARQACIGKVRVYLENAQSIRYHHLTTEEMLITLIHLDGLVHRLLLYSARSCAVVMRTCRLALYGCT